MKQTAKHCMSQSSNRLTKSLSCSLSSHQEHLTDLQLVKAVEQVKLSDVQFSILWFSYRLSVLPHLFQNFPSASSLWFK